MDGWQWLAAAGGGGQTAAAAPGGDLAGAANLELLATKSRGKSSRRKREDEEDHQGLGGEGITAEEEIGRRLRRGRSGGDRAAVRKEERGEVRDTQGVVLPLYRAEGGEGTAR
jgi:hypothetical protein